MSDLQVIYDSSLELAAIVDLDTNLGFGPICPGPNGGQLLQAFIDGMPFDVGILSAEQARDIFLSVFREDVAASVSAAADPATPPLEPSGSASATEQALATADAVASAGAPPPPAPHDADMEADASETAQVTVPGIEQPSGNHDMLAGVADAAASDGTSNCMVCNPQGTGSNNAACVVCGGSGKVRAA